MKKIILVIGILFLILISNTFILKNNKNKNNNKVTIKSDSKKVNNVRTLYVMNVPKVNQEYTISANSYTKIEEKEIVSDEVNETYEDNIIEDESVNIVSDEENTVENNVLIEEKEKLLLDSEDKKEDINEAENQEEIVQTTSEPIKQIDINYLKNGFYEEDGNTYYYENNNKVTGLKEINGVNNYFSPSGKYLGISKVKVIDVSYYQKDINWDLFASDSDCYGVILRLGYYNTLDKKFERNLSEVKRLNIPYGIYLFSYASSIKGARIEALFTNNMIDKYDIKPTLGIYYDLESWKTSTSSSDSISKNGYNYIAKEYVESVSNHINNNYDVGIYSGRWYAMNRLGKTAKGYVSWVAEYNNTLKYDGPYKMWQYTSKGNIPGIIGNVDISYLY